MVLHVVPARTSSSSVIGRGIADENGEMGQQRRAGGGVGGAAPLLRPPRVFFSLFWSVQNRRWRVREAEVPNIALQLLSIYECIRKANMSQRHTITTNWIEL